MSTPAIPTVESVPLAVWPVAQVTGQYQRAGRYLPASTGHPGKMLPELARRIVSEYSAPGQLVADPMCGIGTTLVEAATLGRRCIGVELEPRWAALANANLDHTLTGQERALAQVRLGDARHLAALLNDVAGTVDVVATSPPYACDAEVIDWSAWRAGGSLGVEGTRNYSTSAANLGHARGQVYLAAMAEIYAACFGVLRPGGLLVTVTKNTRPKGRLFDLAAATVRLACQAGFGYLQHVIALHAAIREGVLVARPSFWQVSHIRKARTRGEPIHLVAHEDVLVFVKPEQEAARG
jgi:modification methylase